jgi:hypothetical protein
VNAHLLSCKFNNTSHISEFHREQKDFQDLPLSGDEQDSDDMPPRALGKRKHACSAYRQIPPSDDEPDLDDELDLDDVPPCPLKKMNINSDCSGRDNTFDPQPEDEYGDEHQPPYSTILAGIQTLRDVRVAINGWVSILGPVEEWPAAFHFYYEVARGKNTVQAVDEFLESVERHADRGRDILKRLRESPVVSPPPSHEAWGDFLAAGDLMETLYRGIAILEARLDIFAPRGPLASGRESNVRKWVV